MIFPFDRVRLGDTLLIGVSCSSGKSVRSLSSFSGINSTCLPLLERLILDCPEEMELPLLRVVVGATDEVDGKEASEEAEAPADIVRERSRVAGGEKCNWEVDDDTGDD